MLLCWLWAFYILYVWADTSTIKFPYFPVGLTAHAAVLYVSSVWSFQKPIPQKFPGIHFWVNGRACFVISLQNCYLSPLCKTNRIASLYPVWLISFLHQTDFMLFSGEFEYHERLALVFWQFRLFLFCPPLKTTTHTSIDYQFTWACYFPSILLSKSDDRWFFANYNRSLELAQ